jgi:hypothetical protein
MNHISEYDNIFHYFKGQSGDESNTLQSENNATKALINVLQHGSKELTDCFLKLIDESVTLKKENEFTFMLQITDKLEDIGTTGFVLGIAENINERHASDYSNKNSIPDAAIVSDEIVVLIETKIGTNSKLDTGQMEKHKEKFHKNQVFQHDFEFLTWGEIREFFKEKQKIYTNETITGFLLHQFDQFCEINGLGGRTRAHYFNYFSLKARKLAIEIDDYLWNGTFEIIDPPNTERGIAYKRKDRRGGFAKLCTDRKCLILRYGRQGSSKGLEFQDKINQLLGIIYPRSNTDNKEYLHETYLDLRWVKDLNDIKPFIQKAYEMKP